MDDPQPGSKLNCPVCCMEPAENLVCCRRCGWQLNAGQEQEQAPRLEEQRRKFIRGAAAVAHTAGEFNQALFSHLTQGLSEAGVEHEQVYSACQEYKVQFSQFLQECEQREPILQELIETAQRQGTTLVFAAAHRGGIQLGVLDPSRPGPEMWLRRDVRNWSEYNDESLAAFPERDLALATGMAPGLDQLADWLGDFVQQKLTEWQIPESQMICVGYNLSGWAAVDDFIRGVAIPGRPICSIPYHPARFENLDARITHALRKTPPRHTFGLLLASVNRGSGAVTLAPHVLFPKDVPVDPASETPVPVRLENSQGQPGILAVVKCGENLAHWEVMQAWEADLPPGPLQVRAMLPEPGRVQLSVPGCTLRTVHWSSQRIRRETPGVLSVGLDLALILDTVADEAAFKERIQFARELIAQFQARLGHRPGRVAVFAYGDREHGNLSHPRPPFLRGQGLNSAAEALNFLGKLSLTPLASNDFEAALEDALQAVHGLRWGSGRQRVVVTIGQRPPHPLTARYPNQMINRNLDWEEWVQKIKTGLKARSWVVRCPLLWPSQGPLHAGAREYSDQFWQAWGYTGIFELPHPTPATVVQAIFNLPPQDPPLRIPLLANVLEP